MNPFRPLLKLLDFVLGHDLQEERAEKKAPVVRPRPPRSQAPQGDGFERGSRGPNVDLGGGRKSAPKLPDEPAGPPAVIEPSNFNASLEDLSHLVNEPMEPRPEFIPEGGMSTESLMREFSSLDSETQAAAVEQAAARELEQQSFDEVVDSFESAPASASVVVAQDLPPPPPAAPTADFSHLVDAPMEAKPAFVAPGGMSTESLMDEFSSLDAETQAAAVAEAAAKEAARKAEEEALEEEPELAPVSEPAPSGLSTESLMGEFESLDSETQAAAVEQHAAREAARAEAEAAEEAVAPLPAAQGKGATDPDSLPAADAVARAEAAKRAAAEAAAAAQAAIARAAEAQKLADEAVARAAAQTAPKPEPTRPERLTPAWLVPATTAAPKKTMAAPAPGLSTESLMSEFESLDADTQQKAIDEAAARELVRQQQEEANRKKAEEGPLPAPQGDGEKD